jgi:NTP pyrophosphatase (non-canonical NTP hydrolase)
MNGLENFMQKKLSDIVDAYYEYRGLTTPDANQAYLFLVSEVGELADALVANQADWVRNNPDRERNIEPEIGDVLMMLTVCASQLGIDPVEAMVNKMKSKGFEFEG